MRLQRILAVVLLTALGTGEAATAAEVYLYGPASTTTPTPIAPITATANSNYPDREPGDTVGGFNFTTGLSAGSGPVDPDTGLVFPQHNTSTSQMWLTNNIEPGAITFDLGSVFTLDRMWIYNYNEAGSNFKQRGAATTGTVEYSLDGVTYNPLPLSSNLALTEAPATSTYDEPDVVGLGLVDARFVRLSNLNSFPNGDNNYMGLSEVIFFQGTAPVALTPEPGSILLFGAMLAAGGFYGWRRRTAQR